MSTARKFDLAEAQRKAGSTYVMQEPEADCPDCKGTGIIERTMCIGMDTQKVPSYCECTIKGLGKLR